MATENYSLSIQGQVSNSYNECVLTFQSAGLSSTDTLDAGDDLIAAFRSHAEGEWLDCLPVSYQLGVYQARRLFPKPSAQAHHQYQPQTQMGTAGSTATAYNLCPSVFLVPPMGIPSGGRIFMPAVSQGDVVNNGYDAGYITRIDAFMTAVTNGMAGSGTNWKLGIYSRKNVSVALVQTWVLSPRLGFQGKRRQPSGG